jgi:AcrR family transcriptional regulator
MNHLVTLDPAQHEPATYAERRAAMADETRTRILDACVTILARGVGELSIPAVARAAKVSVPTVYRNFADKKTLLRETAMHLWQLRGKPNVPPTLDELPETIRKSFCDAASATETVRAALTSELYLGARREIGEPARRIDRSAQLLEPVVRHMPPRDRELAALVTAVLCSSASLRAFREVAQSTPEEAAEAVSWAISRILQRPWQVPAGADAPPPAAPPAKTTPSPKKKGNKR